MALIRSAEILFPQGVDLERWAVVACDQFTSEPAYWQRVRERAGDSPSALNLIFPEAELNERPEARIGAIHAAMEAYEKAGLFAAYPGSYVYVERTLADGMLRRGLVGALDLEAYDYTPQAETPVRATERTVLERIPPRVRIREGAPLELPHVLLLCDDEKDAIFAPLAEDRGEPFYDFELMEGGGHIRGWLLQGEAAAATAARLDDYEARKRAAAAPRAPMLYAVGDGNHSLASAKACYEKLKETLGAEEASRHPARWALVELENLEDPVQRFEPIHRIVKNTDTAALLADAGRELGGAGGGKIRWRCGGAEGELQLDEKLGALPVGVLQAFLDRWLGTHPGEIDYIHGDETLRRLADAPGCVGFLLPAIEKDAFFAGIMADGVLPRKTFSMGHAHDKRYYLEARRIL